MVNRPSVKISLVLVVSEMITVRATAEVKRAIEDHKKRSPLCTKLILPGFSYMAFSTHSETITNGESEDCCNLEQLWNRGT
jgi:hypothetical protein